VDSCTLLRDGHGLSTVALSGDVFEDQLLLRRTVAGLETQGFTVLTYSHAPYTTDRQQAGEISCSHYRSWRALSFMNIPKCPLIER
jgi:hydrogenase maturation protein HypF